MSRVGKQPVAVPSGVKTAIESGVVRVEGPKGKLEFTPGFGVGVKQEQGQIIVTKVSNGTQANANWGSARAIINNMVLGVSKGFKKSLELNGVGYNAKMQGQTLCLSVGFSHDVNIELPKEVKCTITKNTVELESADKQLVGNLAAKIRMTQPVEPYLGKGIKYTDETVRRKAGKTGKK